MKLLLSIFLIVQLGFTQSLIQPIPLHPTYNITKARLGKKLFFDTKLSHDGTISCASCHVIGQGGDDGQRVSFGINGQRGGRNAPTVLNARYNIAQFWDGRAKDLQDQASGPVENPVEMGSNFKEVVAKLNKDKNYQKEFFAIYKKGITKETITDAIAEFEKTLTTPNSKFDKYLRGDKNALTKDELKGYHLFKDYGCISCHNGINIGGNLFQKIGVFKTTYKTDDFGVYDVTKKEEDKYYFKVPSLRNIALTAPYSHDGKVKTLDDAIKLMSKLQIGYELDEDEILYIKKFLNTLTGEIPKMDKR